MTFLSFRAINTIIDVHISLNFCDMYEYLFNTLSKMQKFIARWDKYGIVIYLRPILNN